MLTAKKATVTATKRRSMGHPAPPHVHGRCQPLHPLRAAGFVLVQEGPSVEWTPRWISRCGSFGGCTGSVITSCVLQCRKERDLANFKAPIRGESEASRARPLPDGGVRRAPRPGKYGAAVGPSASSRGTYPRPDARLAHRGDQLKRPTAQPAQPPDEAPALPPPTSRWSRLRRFLIGGPRNTLDPKVYHHISTTGCPWGRRRSRRRRSCASRWRRSSRAPCSSPGSSSSSRSGGTSACCTTRRLTSFSRRLQFAGLSAMVLPVRVMEPAASA